MKIKIKRLEDFDSDRVQYAKAFAVGFLQGAIIVVASAVLVNGVLATFDNIGDSVSKNYERKFYDVVSKE